MPSPDGAFGRCADDPRCRITDTWIVPRRLELTLDVLGIVVLGALTLGAILFAEFSE